MKYEIKPKDLLMLINLGNNFEQFNDLLSQIAKKSPKKCNLLTLIKLTKGKKIFTTREKRKIYNQLLLILEEIKEYPSLGIFLFTHYNNQGKLKPKSPLMYYHKYIKEHKTDINKIKTLVSTLADEKYTAIILDTGKDFNQETVQINLEPNSTNNKKLTLFEHMQILPSLDTNKICYQSKNSNYKIEIPINVSSDINNANPKIYLNSLLLNPNCLPKHINKKEAFDNILKQAKEKRKQTEVITTSIKIGKTLETISQNFSQVIKLANDLPEEYQGEELTIALLKGRLAIEQLKTIRNAQNEKMISSNPEIKLLLKQKSSH